MPKVTYVALDGSATIVDAVEGDSVMATAVRHGVIGIVGECGGNSTCATCHVYVRSEDVERVGPPGPLEDDMLDLAVTERRESSRLSCQITVTSELDGLVVDLPEVQP